MEVGAYEAKTHLPKLLDQVEDGASIVITRNGKAVARLVPVESTSTSDAIARILKLRESVQGGGLSMRELIDVGRL